MGYAQYNGCRSGDALHLRPPRIRVARATGAGGCSGDQGGATAAKPLAEATLLRIIERASTPVNSRPERFLEVVSDFLAQEQAGVRRRGRRGALVR